MKEESKQALKELKVALITVLIFLTLAALIISFYYRTNIVSSFETTILHVLTAGTGGVLGNIFYVIIIFLTLGITFYMFEKVIILLSDVKVGGVLMRLNLSTIKDHYIVCGAGRVGTHTAERLKNVGKKVVVIDNDCPKIEFLKKRGYTAIEGDCMNEESLERAGIRRAKGILACMGEDSKNVFVILTARDLNPSIRIAARANDQKSKDELQRAGAHIIVAPEVTGGYELAEKIAKF